MTGLGEVRPGPPVGRHVAAVGLTAVVTLIFMWIAGNDADVRPFYLGHEILAATSLVLLCVILMLGPAARFLPRLRPVVPWGRELGIAMFVTAGLHVAILNDFDLDVREFFGDVGRGDFEFGTHMWHAANWVGAVALGYGLVLAATSNNWSQRKLGRGWKFLQRQSYTLFVLAWLHVAAFVVIGAGHGAILDSWLFWGITTAVVVVQLAGFVHTVRAPRGPSRYRVPPKSASPGVASTAALRWIGVVALWAAAIGGCWLTTGFKSEEDRQVDRVCERYEELGRPPLAEIRDELLEFVSADWDARDLQEAIDTCTES